MRLLSPNLRLLRALALAFAASLSAAACAAKPDAPAIDPAWEARAANVTITRDDWGIAHVKGKSDADAVFGMIYAQAEDDFNRIEVNYLNAMGRLAEAEGESAIWRDLRMKLFVDPDSMKALYESSEPWLKSLMNAWADGLNYYLATHPEVKPRVITRFEPWMALTFSEGSIGGDIETVSLARLEAFYGKRPVTTASGGRATDWGKRPVTAVASGRTVDRGRRPGALASRPLAQAEWHEPEPSGSNGIAIAPANTQAKRALLLINPHTSFFFRSELQMTSDEGLNAYGAATWGQFFIYQGFNERAGWMHTSSGADAIDEYAETVVPRGEGYVYRYGGEERPVAATTITIPFRTDTGMARRDFTVYRTHHGPIVREADGRWIAVKLMQEPLKALTQSYTRTRARNLADFRQTMELRTNSSNNTVFADAEGNIAYFQANFVPKRDARLDWRRPVDGSDPATEWQGIHAVDESPNVINPGNGWIQNTNNWPYSASGPTSPRRSAYPAYMEYNVENPRGVHAIRVLEGKKDFTIESLVAAAYDSYLPAFADLVPTLLAAYDRTPATDPLRAKVAEQVEALRTWDYRWAVTSVPTSLAVFWGEELWRTVRADAESEDMSIYDFMAKRTSPAEKLAALAAASDSLAASFGSWKTPWGEINRFQRISPAIVHPYDDAKPSIPVGFTSSRWGSLASFGARPHNGSRKWYGTSGNSFVAVVEFGDSVRARAVTAGGESGDPSSRHFNDQAERYAAGNLREVYFYPSQLQGHTERTYRPGK